MHLDKLETGQPFGVNHLLKIVTTLLPRMPLDVVKLLTYRPEFFGSPFCRAGHALMRGSRAIVGWTIGQRELMGAFTSALNGCGF